MTPLPLGSLKWVFLWLLFSLIFLSYSQCTELTQGKVKHTQNPPGHRVPGSPDNYTVTRQLKQIYYSQCKWHSKYRKITLKTNSRITGRRYHHTQTSLPSFSDTPFLAHIYGKAVLRSHPESSCWRKEDGLCQNILLFWWKTGFLSLMFCSRCVCPRRQDRRLWSLISILQGMVESRSLITQRGNSLVNLKYLCSCWIIYIFS